MEDLSRRSGARALLVLRRALHALRSALVIEPQAREQCSLTRVAWRANLQIIITPTEFSYQLCHRYCYLRIY